MKQDKYTGCESLWGWEEQIRGESAFLFWGAGKPLWGQLPQ